MRVSNRPALINALGEDVYTNNNNHTGHGGNDTLVKRLGEVGSTNDNDSFQLFKTVTINQNGCDVVTQHTHPFPPTVG